MASYFVLPFHSTRTPTSPYLSNHEAKSTDALLSSSHDENDPQWPRQRPLSPGLKVVGQQCCSRLVRGAVVVLLFVGAVGALLRCDLRSLSAPVPSPAQVIAHPTKNDPTLQSALDHLLHVVAQDPAHQTTGPPVAQVARPNPTAGEGRSAPAAVIAPGPATTPSPPAAGPSSEKGPPRTSHRVGPRTFSSRYNQTACSSSQLLDAVAAARIKPDGASRLPLEWSSNSLPPSFEFSYELEGCPPPHKFSPAETCDLLNSFGGVYMRGDSLMRQFAQGVFMLLADSLDLVRDEKEACAGNKLFTNGKLCKFHSHFDSREIVSQVCGEQVAMRYQQLFAWQPEPHWDPTTSASSLDATETSTKLVKRGRPSVESFTHELQQYYKDFVRALPAKTQALSPIYIHGTGIHYYWNTTVSRDYHVTPFLRTADESSPRPFAIWALNPAPGWNKPSKYKLKQGPGSTLKYNARMKALLDQVNGEEKQVARGAWAAMDFYNTTDGAASFDGTHYSYQVAMERAQVLLNYLDLVWSEVVDLGGLVE